MNNVFERKATVYSIDGTMRIETSVKLINRAAADMKMPKGNEHWKFPPVLAGYLMIIGSAWLVSWLAIRIITWIAR